MPFDQPSDEQARHPYEHSTSPIPIAETKHQLFTDSGCRNGNGAEDTEMGTQAWTEELNRHIGVMQSLASYLPTLGGQLAEEKERSKRALQQLAIEQRHRNDADEKNSELLAKLDAERAQCAETEQRLGAGMERLQVVFHELNVEKTKGLEVGQQLSEEKERHLNTRKWLEGEKRRRGEVEQSLRASGKKVAALEGELQEARRQRDAVERDLRAEKRKSNDAASKLVEERLLHDTTKVELAEERELHAAHAKLAEEIRLCAEAKLAEEVEKHGATRARVVEVAGLRDQAEMKWLEEKQQRIVNQMECERHGEALTAAETMRMAVEGELSREKMESLHCGMELVKERRRHESTAMELAKMKDLSNATEMKLASTQAELASVRTELAKTRKQCWAAEADLAKEAELRRTAERKLARERKRSSCQSSSACASGGGGCEPRSEKLQQHGGTTGGEENRHAERSVRSVSLRPSASKREGRSYINSSSYHARWQHYYGYTSPRRIGQRERTVLR